MKIKMNSNKFNAVAQCLTGNAYTHIHMFLEMLVNKPLMPQTRIISQ